MERYQRGHQQPVEGARPVGTLLVLACAVRQIHDALFCTLRIIDKAGHMDIARLAGLLMDKLPIPFLLRARLHLHQIVQP